MTQDTDIITAIEYRVVTTWPGKYAANHEPLYQKCRDLEFAESWIALERSDYPHYKHWIESRVVSAWTKLDEKEDKEAPTTS